MNTELLNQFINKADIANSKKKYSTALKWCNKALKLSPDLPEAWYHLGVALGGLGQRSKAINSLEKARLATVNSADAQNAIGLEFIELGAYTNAEE